MSTPTESTCSSRASEWSQGCRNRSRAGRACLCGPSRPPRLRASPCLRSGRSPADFSTYGIIVLREPMETALAEVEMIRRLGVKIETGVELGGNADWSDIRPRFDAVFLSVGLGLAAPSLGIPGEEHISMASPTSNRARWTPHAMKIGRNVVVIGAGNTAIDCATIAKRLGAERVTMVYRRTEREMTAYPHEYEFVKLGGSGVPIPHTAGSRASGTDSVIGLECVRMKLGAPDPSGRPAPKPVPNSQFLIPADQVVKAIGQENPQSQPCWGWRRRKALSE